MKWFKCHSNVRQTRRSVLVSTWQSHSAKGRQLSCGAALRTKPSASPRALGHVRENGTELRSSDWMVAKIRNHEVGNRFCRRSAAQCIVVGGSQGSRTRLGLVLGAAPQLA